MHIGNELSLTYKLIKIRLCRVESEEREGSTHSECKRQRIKADTSRTLLHGKSKTRVRFRKKNESRDVKRKERDADGATVGRYMRLQ